MNSNINRFLILVFTCVLAMVISPLAIPDYVNITKQAGIDFKHNNGAFGKKYLPETAVEVRETYDPRSYRVSFDKAARVLNFKTTRAVEEGIIEMKEALREHKASA